MASYARHDDERTPALVTVIHWLSTLRPVYVVGLAVGLFAVIAFADFTTGPAISLTVAYQLPVFVTAAASRRLSVLTAALSSGVCTTMQALLRTEPYPAGVLAWNLLARFLVLWLVASLVSALATRFVAERHLSRNDFLTGLPNARALHEQTGRELARMRRSRSALTAAFIDVDNFKAVNDTHGHARGDELLAAVGRTLAAAVRAQDTVARVGGDEFAVLLPGADREEALDRLGALHRELHAATRDFTPAVAFSIGAVTFTDPPPSSTEVLELPDRLMYLVKLGGKGMVRAETATAMRAGPPSAPRRADAGCPALGTR
ncbi:GGDEF domain-containing protein [Dactylosporangium sp. NPDC000555]|uniref:GGDEF domain-containing protein n=1 Tax=Dactylosporangium sp. NPDC000555 TaxID=3154260 RepID=UPI003325EED3